MAKIKKREDKREMKIEGKEVWAIINATPDSFFAGSRAESEGEIARAAMRALQEGADCLDIGGYSTRPGHQVVPEDEEFRRLDEAMQVIRQECGSEVRLSVDTFRSSVVERLYDRYGEFVVNDIEGGVNDLEMYALVGRLGLDYVMMSSEPNVEKLVEFFGVQIARAKEFGVEGIMVDPGFGFGKSLEENFEVLAGMSRLSEFGLPIFAGVSRKSMIFKSLGCTPAEALNGTSLVHFAALERGADILRVHDVKEAREAIKIFEAINQGY